MNICIFVNISNLSFVSSAILLQQTLDQVDAYSMSIVLKAEIWLPAVASVSDDHMIQERDLEDGGGLDELLGHAPVGHAGGAVARGVIMNQRNGVSAGQDRGSENLPRMGNGLIQRAHGNDVVGSGSQIGIQDDGHQMFLVRLMVPALSDDLAPKTINRF